MRRSTHISSSRLLIAATVLIVICGALLCIPRASNVPLTASIAPSPNTDPTVPAPRPEHEPRHLTPHEDTTSQIEVPRILEQDTANRHKPIERVAMLQPIHTFSDQPTASVYKNHEDKGGLSDDSFGEEFEFEDEFEDAPVENPPVEDAPFEDTPFEDTPFENSTATIDAFEPEKADVADFDDTSFDIIEPTLPNPSAEQNNFSDLETEFEFEPQPATTPAAVPDFEPYDEKPVATKFDEARFKAEMQKMRADLAQSTEQKIRDAQREHQLQIERLQTEIDKLRSARKTVEPKMARKPTPALLVGRPPELTVVPKAKRKPATTKDSVVADRRSEQSEPTMLPPTIPIPTIPVPNAKSAPMPKTVKIPQPHKRMPVAYPPIDMTPTTRSLSRSTTARTTQPAYLYITPAPRVAPQSPIGQPTRSTTSPQCTRSSPRRSLLSRLRSSRPEPCKYCGQIH